jgi:putative glycosyltransferase (exosortase G-associated)
MKEQILGIAIYWGVWLILPILVDGINALVVLVQVAIARLRARRATITDVSPWPGLSLIVPVYNGEDTLGHCLDSLRRQNYPPEQVEIIVVDNGSTDGTCDVFHRVNSQPYRGQMHLISIAGRGKSYALNAGLHLTSHPYLCTIDADAVIHPNAMREMVRHFEADHRLAAATGAVEVLPVPDDQKGDRMAFLIAECEFQEYLSAFWLGRQGQALSESLFTLAGVFSFFRREVLLNTQLYDKQTVSEDTKITFDIRRQFGGERLACIPEAIIYVTPTPSLSSLYSQRVRWQRGEIEVAAVHDDLVDSNILRFRGLSLARMLLIDHTFIFPRLVWSFVFPALIFFGYPLSLIVGALGLIYAFYALLAMASALSVYLIVPADIRARLKRTWWIAAIMPAYRMFIFISRLAGCIITIAEPAGWRVRDPITETRNALNTLADRIRERLSASRGGH